MGFGRFARIASAAAVLSGLAIAVGPARAAAPLGPGCDATRTADAYYSGGAPAAASEAAQPCLVATGFGGAETQVVSLKSGALVYEPAILTPGLAGTGFVPGAPGPTPSTQFSPGGLAISGDDSGASWNFNEPGGATWVPQDDALYVDRTTGRLFFYALAANPVPAAGQVPLQDQVPAGEAHLMSSGDGGATWNEVGLPGYVESENPRFTSAPPVGGAPTAGGYPDVTYWCGNDAVNLGQPLPGYRACYRSLDGGASWKFASILASGPVPQHSQCGGNAETFADIDPNYPEGGAPDGSLYAEVTCGGVTYLARSTDEAGSWPLVTTAGGKPVTLPADGELRVDGSGNLYLVYLTGQSTLNLLVSRDGGVTWGKALDMTPPGAAQGTVVQWAVAERGDGEVAASYLVQRGSGSLYDGYLSVTFDALDTNTEPVFFGAALNSPSDPLRTSAPAPARDDYVGVDITPSGTPWASFAASCPGPVPGSPACAGQSGNSEANEAVAGRLAFPSAP